MTEPSVETAEGRPCETAEERAKIRQLYQRIAEDQGDADSHYVFRDISTLCNTLDARDAARSERPSIIIGLPTIHALVRGEAVELDAATLYGAEDLQTWGRWTENDGSHDAAVAEARAAERERLISEPAIEAAAKTLYSQDEGDDPGWECDDEALKRDYRSCAKAAMQSAIRALRDPGS